MLHDKVLRCSINHKYFYGVEMYGPVVWVCSRNVTDKKAQSILWRNL